MHAMNDRLRNAPLQSNWRQPLISVFSRLMTQKRPGFDARFVPVGIAIGVDIGVALEQLALGIAIGLAVGVLLGMARGRR